MWEALGQIAAVFLAIAGIAKLFVNDYFKKAKELETIKRRRTDDVLRSLRETIDDHKVELRNLRVSLDSTNSALHMTDKELNGLKNEIASYTRSGEVRMTRLETQIIKISEDVLLVKGKTNAKRNQ